MPAPIFSPAQTEAQRAAIATVAARFPTASYIIAFDGGANPNPGTAYGSYALIARATNGPLRHRVVYTDFQATMTNNHAEYQALATGLHDLEKTIRRAHRHPREFHLGIAGDSQLVLNQLGGTYRVNERVLQRARAEVIEIVTAYASVTYAHHPRAISVALFQH